MSTAVLRVREHCRRRRQRFSAFASIVEGVGGGSPRSRGLRAARSALFLPSVEAHEVEADEDEGHAEPLPHVQRHAVLEVHLVLLEELDEEAENEDFRQAEAEEEAAVIGRGDGSSAGLGSLAEVGARCGGRRLLLPAAVEPHHAEEEDEIGQRLVELGGVAGHHVHALEDEGPGDVRRAADDFGVHQVGQADAAGGHGRGHGNHVEHVHVVHPRLAAVEPEGEDKAQRAAVAGQPLVARELPSAVRQELHGKDHFPEVVQVVVGLVEQAVAQAGTDEDTEEAVEEQRFELVVADAPVAVFFLHDEVGKSQADDPQQAIVTDGDAEEVEQLGIGVPVDVE